MRKSHSNRDIFIAGLFVVLCLIIIMVYPKSNEYAATPPSNAPPNPAQLVQCTSQYQQDYDTVMAGVENPYGAEKYVQTLIDSTQGLVSCQKQYGDNSQCQSLYQLNKDIATNGIANPYVAQKYTPLLQDATRGLQSC
jgi:hypothetical protein